MLKTLIKSKLFGTPIGLLRLSEAEPPNLEKTKRVESARGRESNHAEHVMRSGRSSSQPAVRAPHCGHLEERVPAVRDADAAHQPRPLVADLGVAENGSQGLLARTLHHNADQSAIGRR